MQFVKKQIILLMHLKLFIVNNYFNNIKFIIDIFYNIRILIIKIKIYYYILTILFKNMFTIIKINVNYKTKKLTHLCFFSIKPIIKTGVHLIIFIFFNLHIYILTYKHIT